MSEPHNCENGGCLMDEFCCHDVANLQARLAQCEGALKLRDDELKKQQEASLVFVRERDAALERVKVLEEKIETYELGYRGFP